jgi:uncharacterized protein
MGCNVPDVSDTRFLLTYDYVADVLERRPPYREEHLALVRSWKEEGRILMGGPLGDPPTGAAIIFKVDDPAEVEQFVASDPYVSAGIVTAHRVQLWTLV